MRWFGGLTGRETLCCGKGRPDSSDLEEGSGQRADLSGGFKRGADGVGEGEAVVGQVEVLHAEAARVPDLGQAPEHRGEVHVARARLDLSGSGLAELDVVGERQQFQRVAAPAYDVAHVDGQPQAGDFVQEDQDRPSIAHQRVGPELQARSRRCAIGRDQVLPALYPLRLRPRSASLERLERPLEHPMQGMAGLG